MEVVAHIWWFRVTAEVSPVLEKQVSIAMSNPLAFHRGSIRNIAERPEMHVAGTHLPIGPSSQIDFINTFDSVSEYPNITKHLQAKDGRFDIRWRRWWHNSQDPPNCHAPNWLGREPQIYTDNWDGSWTGQLRKVKIMVILRFCPDVGDASTKLIELTEDLAKRLVGTSGAVTRTSSYEDDPIWRETCSFGVTVGVSVMHRNRYRMCLR
jgi:hypothetical protein